MNWMKQGPNGPRPANRPPQQILDDLKDTDDYLTAMFKAQQLALAGYDIFVPVDAWGRDEDIVFAQLRIWGYKWVPTALMPPVTVAPGLKVPGMVSYDAEKPPIGAILL